MALNRHPWLVFALLIALNDICKALSIDSTQFTEHFVNQTTIPLPECNEFCGSGPNQYEWNDIQARVVTWIVPVIILVGSFQFAPLRLLNTMFVALHLMADPFTSIFSLLTKLATHQKIYNDCQRPEIPDAARKSMAILLAAYEDWESYFLFLKRGNKDDLTKALSDSMKKTSEALQHLLCDQQFPLFNDARIMECQAAAKELSDSRVNGLAKTLIGNANYFVTLVLAFIQVNKGNFNNRTGHSIAFGMIWTWLVVIVFLSSIIGIFINKRSARRVLERLQRHLDRIELAELQELERLRSPDEPQRPGSSQQPEESESLEACRPIEGPQQNSHDLLRPALFTFHVIDNTMIKQAYQSLEWAGMNYSATPSPLCQGNQKKALICVAAVPVLIATASAFWISVTNPTNGVGCRSIYELCCFSVWILSAVLSAQFRRFEGEKQLFWTRAKDFIICLTLWVSIAFGFGGWFNSCFCWSAWFSLYDKAYIVVNPTADIQQLAKITWPAITGTVIGLQLLFILAVFLYFQKGARLYSVSDVEHETWQDPSMWALRKESQPSVMKGRGRTYSESFPFVLDRSHTLAHVNVISRTSTSAEQVELPDIDNEIELMLY